MARTHRAAMEQPRRETVLDRGARTSERRAGKISASMVFRRFDGDQSLKYQKLFCASIQRYSYYSKVFFVFLVSHVFKYLKHQQTL